MRSDITLQHKPILWAPLLISTLLFSSSVWSVQNLSEESPVEDFLDASLSDLLSINVTTVSRKNQPLSESAAAIFVITQNDIKQSGVTSIPEALRMAPGVQVARINASQWAITIRGYNGRFSNKLLVLMDGRSVYSPTFSGVYWDAQDTLIEDIERIEVIRGPGATLWGANAVNGVINVITKNSDNTQDGLVSLGTGSEEKSFVGLRYGTEINDNVSGRFYFKHFDRDNDTLLLNNEPAGDKWDSLRAGFRIDSNSKNKDSWTFQGDIFDNNVHQIVSNLWQRDSTTPSVTDDIVDTNGWNLLGRWQHLFSDESSSTLQIYYDYTERNAIFLGRTHDTIDIDFQHNTKLNSNHSLIWGAGYRNIRDSFDNTFSISLVPEKRTDNLYSFFIQDEIKLIADRLRLTLGSKFEHNDYTGYEVQPSIKLLWKAHEKHTFWGAISRAVRTPSRVETDGNIVTAVLVPATPPFLPDPVTLSLKGNTAYESETVIAYEAGYRTQIKANLALDLAIFYNDYKNIQSFELNSTTLSFDNNVKGNSTGLEAVVDWVIFDWWNIQTSYSYIDVNAKTTSQSNNTSAVLVYQGSSPDHQFSIRSTTMLTTDWKLNLWAYYVDKLNVSSTTALRSDIKIDDYTSLNARISWQPKPNLAISLAGHNLLKSNHLEFIGENFTPPTMVDRSVYIKADFIF